MVSRYAALVVIGLATLTGLRAGANEGTEFPLSKLEFKQKLHERLSDNVLPHSRYEEWVGVLVHHYDPHKKLVMELWYEDAPTVDQVKLDGDDIIKEVRLLLIENGVDPVGQQLEIVCKAYRRTDYESSYARSHGISYYDLSTGQVVFNELSRAGSSNDGNVDPLNKIAFTQALNAEIPKHVTTLRHGDWVEMDFEVFNPKSILILRMWYGDTPTLGQVMCDGDDVINAIKALLKRNGIDPQDELVHIYYLPSQRDTRPGYSRDFGEGRYDPNTGEYTFNEDANRGLLSRLTE